MYERKIPIDLNCSLRMTMSLIGAKWKPCILDELRYGSMRPSELHKVLPEATPRVIDIQLREMVADQLVTKTAYEGFPLHSEYTLTELGRSLLPILDAMIDWGQKHHALFRQKYGHQQ